MIGVPDLILDDCDDERIQVGIYLSPDDPYPQLLSLALILEGASVFTPGYGPPEVGLYHPDGFYFERYFAGSDTILLPDRNIASRFAQIAKGAIATDDLRIVAAIKAFCHFLNITIEPSIAFHELAHKSGNTIANEELAWFRIGDNGDPFVWFDYALGKINCISEPKDALCVEAINLANPLRRWQRNYIVALKIAELEYSNLPHLSRVLTLLDWMHSDFIVAGPAAVLASIYFAPNSPPRKGLLKQLRSPDRERALNGLRNAAWDITHLSDFIKKVKESEGKQSRYLFASSDKVLHKIAKLLFDFSIDGIWTEALMSNLAVWWPEDQAKKITDRLERLSVEISDPLRTINLPQNEGFIENLICRSENLIRGISPKF